MATWTRQKQERKGSYFFSGQFYTTSGVAQALGPAEILAVYLDVQKFAREQNGADYLQVYTDEQGRKLFLIAQLSKDMIASGEYQPDDNYCTLLWSHEY